MSEVLDNYKKQKIDWKLKLSTEAPLSYVRRQVDVLNDILFCVEIPWPLLHLWYKFLEGVPAENVNYETTFVSKQHFVKNVVMSKLSAVRPKEGRERIWMIKCTS